MGVYSPINLHSNDATLICYDTMVGLVSVEEGLVACALLVQHAFFSTLTEKECITVLEPEKVYVSFFRHM